MEKPDILNRMRDDWNARAREDAHYFVAFGRREQDEAEFLATAADVIRSLERELRRVPPAARGAALEIGCGPGRLMRPLSRYFAEIHGVDVSDEMIRKAAERLADIPHAHVRSNDGASLVGFADNSFDFVYSYAVFQHIPSREVVLQYLRETWRVLKPGGYLRCQINGLPEKPLGARLVGTGRAQAAVALPLEYDTWQGVRISAAEVAAFARDHNFQLLALEGEGTQYMWATLRKRAAGSRMALPPALRNLPGPDAAGRPRPPRVCRITNAYSSEPAVPARGRFACVSLWIENLPEDCDLNALEATVGGLKAKPFYIGPPEVDGLQQLNIGLPQPAGTGLVPVEVRWLGAPLLATIWLRVVPPGPAVPRLISVSDGVDLLSRRIVSRTVKVILEEVNEPEKLRARIDQEPAAGIEYLCTDPLPPRYEVNVLLPPGVGAGAHQVHLEIGVRRLAPIPIEVVGN